MRTHRRHRVRPCSLELLALCVALAFFAPSCPVWAETNGTTRHSLIHRPPLAIAPAEKSESQPSQPNPIPQPTPPTTPSRPLHHQLKKKPAAFSSTGSLTPTTSASTPARSTSQPSITSPSIGSIPGEGVSGAQRKFLSDTQPKPAATTPILSSVLGTTAAPSARTASAAQSTGATASSSAAAQLPGSMQRLIQANPSFVALLQAPTPVVSTPPPPPSTPPSTPPPSTPPPSTPTTGSATLTWVANGEPDLAGYKVYVGTASGTYNFSSSPFTIGKVTTYTLSNLPRNNTYFFAISAYDSARNEGPLSTEVSKSIF